MSRNNVNLDIIKNWLLSPAPVLKWGQLRFLLCVCVHTRDYWCSCVCTCACARGVLTHKGTLPRVPHTKYSLIPLAPEWANKADNNQLEIPRMTTAILSFQPTRMVPIDNQARVYLCHHVVPNYRWDWEAFGS